MTGLLSVPGHAQTDSSIVGVVSDATGAVVPGVSVQITGASLIGTGRQTTTDSGGRYRVIDLRPGIYTVTFTAPGFSVLRHENVELAAAFTQTLDAALVLGANNDTVTVSLQAPLVDVQDSVTEQVIDRKALDTVPTGHDIFGVGQLIAGVTTSTPDVGGTTGMQQATLQVHGSSGNDNVFLVDGMWIQHTGFSGNQTGAYYNDSLLENIVYTTDTLPAEAPIGGIQINMIPREGGNQFHGSVFGTGANQFLQSGNLTPDLVKLGLTAPNRIDTIYDINPGLGGPILKDRLWFFGSFRRWGANNFLANTFTPQGTQALDDNRLTDAALRLTGQISKNQRLTVSYDRGFKFRGHRPNNLLTANFNDPLADVVQKTWLNYIAQAKWTFTPTPKLALELGMTLMPVNYNLGFEPGVVAGAVAAYDQITSTISRVSPRADNDRGTFRAYMTSATYVSGRHSLKTGLQMRTGSWQEAFTMNNNMIQVYNSGVPNSIRLYNAPLAHRETMPVDLGWYLQDTWKISKRITINPGIRFQHTNMTIPQQSSPVAQWTVTPIVVNGQSYGTYQAAQNGYVLWNTFSPRLGISWDVFGDSKTAVRGGVSKYDRLEGTTLVQNINQNFLAYRTCPWSATALAPYSMDPNVLPTSYAEIPAGIQAQCTAFSNNGAHLDPGIKRPYQMEYTAMIQHQFGSSTSASAAYYHRTFYDLYGIVNQAVPSTSYTPVTITNPINGQPLTVYNQNKSTLGLSKLYEQTLPNLFQHYNGVEFTVNTRFRKGSVFGSFTWGRSIGTPDGSSTSNDFNNPNNLINLAGNLGYDAPFQIRIGGNYSIWKKIQVSGTLRSNSGLPQSRTYTVTTSIVPGLTQVTQNVFVAAPGSYRYPFQNLVDLRVSKSWSIRERVQFEPVADLFNVFNTSAVTAAVTTIGPSLLKPSGIDFGRMARLGGKVTF
ncbi:TonB-dependent receptor [Granulicella sp. WH15]|uniref:TonB-dependent receptor n=1 Tax=Granulicella sp. WH15 TaxID=2602070 RepID=UPI0013A52D21|nr:TonB-dependent receptor [Granulicella sp. WH15]